MIRLFGKELNIEEIAVGSWLQFPFYFLIGWWVIPLMVLSGVLWAVGGSRDSVKAIRRLGVPLASVVAVIASNPHLWPCLAFIPIGFVILSIGYGIPSKK